MEANRRHFLKSLVAAGASLPMLRSIASAQQADNTLRLGLQWFPATFVPGRSDGITTMGTILLMHRGLLTYDHRGELRGELAESWSQDGEKGWLVRLREASFSNGKAITADDAKYSIERMASDQVGSSLRPYFAGLSVSTVDKSTIRITTPEPVVTIPALLANQQVMIIAKDSDKNGAFGIGAGPYVLDRHEDGAFVEMVRSEHYFKPGLPKYDRVRIVSFQDEAARVSALVAGDVNFIDYVPYNAMDGVEKNPNLALNYDPQGGLLLLTFNGKGIFADARLRKAVAFALRREEIVTGVLYGRGAPLNGVPRTKGSPYYSDETANYWRYDPELVRSLLAEAGKPKGFKCTMLAASDLAQHRDSAVFIQSQLAEVGIKVNFQLSDYSSRLAAGLRGEGDMGINGASLLSSDPDAFSSIQDPNPSLPPSVTRSSNIEVPQLSELLAKGKREFAPEKRTKLYWQADKVCLDYTTFCGIAYRGAGFGLRKSIKGFWTYPGLLSAFSMRALDEVAPG
ncbi:ABC transporter substrate-binding protein [Bradyrhizobium sp. BWA-3-5]|uniref:ABC transporter substrate-binding protein n=1 Tax=Bradyrhizobium sp. BWA-3-5 TaxID=3080013 RepID=UPI00293F39D7|nr:ABC transporter substrate-binding protein [Bradyrhizobium sp. BWA-3-5]WOH63728.1 ABC transporter substrate-binding protein [Bradyrhizobium sp. BWA-3-5]